MYIYVYDMEVEGGYRGKRRASEGGEGKGTRESKDKEKHLSHEESRFYFESTFNNIKREKGTSRVGGYGGMCVWKYQQSTMIYMHENVYVCIYDITTLYPIRGIMLFPEAKCKVQCQRQDTSGVVGWGVHMLGEHSPTKHPASRALCP